MELSEVQAAFKTYKQHIKVTKTQLFLLGDSLKNLNDIKSQSIDLIFADTPYGIGKDSGI